MPKRKREDENCNTTELSHTQLGIDCFYNHDYEKAIDQFDNALRSDSKDSEALTFLGATELKLGNPEKAAEYLDLSLNIQPNGPHALAFLGAAEFELGYFDKSLKDLNEGVEGLKKDLNFRQQCDIGTKSIPFIRLDILFAIAYRGAVHLKLGNLDAALKDLNNTLRFGPVDSFALANRGAVHLKLGNLDIALQDLNEALKLQPKNSFGLANRGVVHLKLENLDEALQDLNEALEDINDDTFALTNRGALFLKQNKLEDALRDVDFALQHHTEDYAFGLLIRGKIFIKQGKLDQAEKDLLEAKRVDNCPEVLDELTRLYKLKGNTGKAIMENLQVHQMRLQRGEVPSLASLCKVVILNHDQSIYSSGSVMEFDSPEKLKKLRAVLHKQGITPEALATCRQNTGKIATPQNFLNQIDVLQSAYLAQSIPKPSI